jgi:hypothetical protein
LRLSWFFLGAIIAIRRDYLDEARAFSLDAAGLFPREGVLSEKIPWLRK